MRRLVLGVGSLLLLQATAQAQLELRPGDVVAIVGNALAERMVHDGTFEARLQLAHPKHWLSVRNLGFAGDEVVTRQRTNGFGTPDEHLAEVNASVVVAMFGEVESFRGEGGKSQFAYELAQYVRHLRETRYDKRGLGERSTRTPDVVLVAPIPYLWRSVQIVLWNRRRENGLRGARP